MTQISRRSLLALAGASLGLAACGNGVGNNGAAQLDARVDATRNYLLERFPQYAQLEQKAVGVLWMPLVTEAGFGLGGSFGRGALRINNVPVDYYSAASASFGFQIGAQQYAHALFFMTPEALSAFRKADGWEAGADARFALPDRGAAAGADTTTINTPIIPVVFGQAGLLAGATLAGTKYTRIIP